MKGKLMLFLTLLIPLLTGCDVQRQEQGLPTDSLAAMITSIFVIWGIISLFDRKRNGGGGVLLAIVALALFCY